MRGNKSKLVESGLIVLGIGSSICYNNLGFIGWLPILASLCYSLAVFQFKNDGRALKLAPSVCIMLIGIFNIPIRSYAVAASNAFLICGAQKTESDALEDAPEKLVQMKESVRTLGLCRL